MFDKVTHRNCLAKDYAFIESSLKECLRKVPSFQPHLEDISGHDLW